MDLLTFGYPCQECGKGTVLRTVFTNYDTPVSGVLVTIPSAVIGICDQCGAEHFAATEVKRWDQIAESQQQNRWSYFRYDVLMSLSRALAWGARILNRPAVTLRSKAERMVDQHEVF